MKRRRAITTGATEEVVHHELWRKFELDPARMLKSLHDFVEEVRCTHPKLEPAKKSDMDDAGLTPNEFKFLQSGKISLVPLLDMGFLEPAKTYKNLRNVMATRPVRKDEVTRHLNRLVKDGFLPTFNVVLFSPGPDGHKYGIVDGQHRIQAMCLLWNDRELFRGRTFEHLSRSTDDIPLIPALVLTSKEATPSQVLKYSLLLNKLYHYGNFSSVYYAICVLDKCMDWGLYKQSMMSRTIESGIRRGGKMVAMYDLCVQGLQDDRMDIPDAMRGISKAVSDDLIRVVCRLHHFGVMEKLVCSMDDPLSKKESSLMAINVWHKCMETMNNYYWFFRHCCTVKNVPWRRSDIDAAMQALMQLYLLSPEGIVLESLDRSNRQRFGTHKDHPNSQRYRSNDKHSQCSQDKGLNNYCLNKKRPLDSSSGWFENLRYKREHVDDVLDCVESTVSVLEAVTKCVEEGKRGKYHIAFKQDDYAKYADFEGVVFVACEVPDLVEFKKHVEDVDKRIAEEERLALASFNPSEIVFNGDEEQKTDFNDDQIEDFDEEEKDAM
ncbi:hypothetical protein B5M09_009818 [Aphanomyces astaci]|uniref:Uncharacterized protein n=1 Tax=Aphanomyces astaci TaxID=112090 RepID=A0A3R7XP28_APHAT|nr:hypothetical protein B5M09_009818 [Aphanomyces astaci]